MFDIDKKSYFLGVTLGCLFTYISWAIFDLI